MAVTTVEMLRLVARGHRNGLRLLPYHWHDPGRQPWQVALRDRILAEVGREEPDVILPQRHSR